MAALIKVSHLLIPSIVGFVAPLDWTFEGLVPLVPSKVVVPVADRCEPNVLAQYALVRLLTCVLSEMYLHICRLIRCVFTQCLVRILP